MSPRSSSTENLQPILLQWFISSFHLLPNDSLYGSPERTLERFLMEDDKGQRYILDKISPTAIPRKLAIAENLERLHLINPSLPIVPYLKNHQNQFISEEGDSYWMLSHFVEHLPLNRQTYWQDGWRGLEMAEFLLDLRHAVLKWPQDLGKSWDPPLEQYIPGFADTIQQRHPGKYALIEPILHHLESFLSSLHRQEKIFCHGDFHPLNILWGYNTIVGVIDWEFSGGKPRLYDIANMLGCLGMENPEALADRMTANFIQYFSGEGFGSKEEWASLVDLMISLRFGWLSEWFRKQDDEMVDLEITYMQFLVEYKTQLNTFWGIVQ
ncbi:aminoglycoside phosphotransferase family protein [bacterium]|nr:aminoglycoside phosphotransferase family protein [bacterium]